ncbi:MAG: mechanosensitive ion channel [Thermostichus sp. DRC_bins_24]
MHLLALERLDKAEFLFAQLEDIPQATNQNPLGLDLNINNIWSLLTQIVTAVVLLIVGWIIATALARLTQILLKRAQFDQRLSRILGKKDEPLSKLSATGIIVGFVFWVIFLLAVVAALDALRLTIASQPLNVFLSQIFSFLPKLGAAAVLAVVALAVATLARATAVQSARFLNSKLLDLDRPLQQSDGEKEGEEGSGEAAPPPILMSDMLGNGLYWLILLFFLPLILSVLELQGALQPVQNLLSDLLGALPFILKAGVIAVVGWFIARIVRGLVINLMTAMGAQRIGQQLGMGQTSLGGSLATIAGEIVYVLILIPTAIAALDALQIAAISEPATAMLNQVLTALPRMGMAGVILILSYAIGRFVAEAVQGFLRTAGFDQVLVWLGLTATSEITSEETPPADARQLWRQPSEVVGIVVLVGIILFGAIAAVEVLNIPAFTAFVSGLVVILGRVLLGILILAVGLYFANLAFRILASSGRTQARFLGQVARIALMTFVGAMALQQMGIALSIVNLAFGLLFGSIAVAIALAFGLGCRSIAAAQVEEWIGLLKGKDRDS